MTESSKNPNSDAFDSSFMPTLPEFGNSPYAAALKNEGVYRPERERRVLNEVEITFYCARERLAEMMEYRSLFGDRDFTRSLSRFLTAGCHWMAANSETVTAANALATEVEHLEQQKRALQATIKSLSLSLPAQPLRPWWKRLFDNDPN